jgi:endonuclease/exonuclease/phosphatase family metal-dependent hydrolase
MTTKLRRFTRIFFILSNVLAAIVFLLACLAPYLNPEKWWFISLLGLGFAVVFFILVLFALLWLIFKPKLVFISLIPILIGWKSLSVFFALHVPGSFNYQKPKETLRVVHWNVARFTEWSRNNNRGSQTRMKMMDQLKEQNADVLCLVEFFHSIDSQYHNNLTYVMNQLGYPYYYYSWDNDAYKQWVGNIILSKHPIVDSGMIRYPRPTQPESLLWADIVYNKDTVRFYTTHLQSVRFGKEDFETIEKIKSGPDDGLGGGSRNIFSKLKRGFINRSTQAHIVKEIISESPYPYVLTGDMNDVPNSYTYFTLKGEELQDVFLKSSFGVGRTYAAISPTLRIDYIFTTKDFEVKQFNRAVKKSSDHYMLVADLKLKK